MGRDTGGRSGTHGPGKEGACGRGSRRVPPAFMELFGAGGVFFTLRGKFFFFPGLQPLRQGTACRVSGRSRGSIAAVPVAWSVPRASRLHGAVRRWRRLFHAPGKIFLFSWAPAAEAGNCLPCRRPEQGEHRGRARGAVCAACLPPSRRCSALAASFSRSGETFCQ